MQALEDVPIFMRAFMGDIKTNIDDVLDVHHMVVTNMVKNKELMNRVSGRVSLCTQQAALKQGRLYNIDAFSLMEVCLQGFSRCSLFSQRWYGTEMVR